MSTQQLLGSSCLSIMGSYYRGLGHLHQSNAIVSASPLLRVSHSEAQPHRSSFMWVRKKQQHNLPLLTTSASLFQKGNKVDQKAMGSRIEWGNSDCLVTCLLMPTSTTWHWYLHTSISSLSILDISFQHGGQWGENGFIKRKRGFFLKSSYN